MKSLGLSSRVTYSLYHHARPDIEYDHFSETSEEQQVHFRKPLRTNNTASDNQSRSPSEHVTEWELHLYIDVEADLGEKVDLDGEALATVVHRWMFAHSVLASNSNSHQILRASEASRDAMRNMSVIVITSKDDSFAVESRTQLSGMERIVEKKSLKAQQFLSVYIYHETSNVESTWVVDISLLCSIFFLRFGSRFDNPSPMKNDYLRVLGVLEVESHSVPHRLLDYFPKPMPKNGYASFRVEGPSSTPVPSEPSTGQSSAPSSALPTYRCFRNPDGFALGTNGLHVWDNDREGYCWRIHNGFVATFCGRYRFSAWTTAVYAIALEREANAVQHSISNAPRSNSAPILDDRKNREAEIEFGDMIREWYPILAYAARGLYRVGRFVVFVEHGKYGWLSDRVMLRPSLLKRLRGAIRGAIDLVIPGILEYRQILSFGRFVDPRFRSMEPHPGNISIAGLCSSGWNKIVDLPQRLGRTVKHSATRCAARLNFSPWMNWHVIDIRPPQRIQGFRNGQFEYSEASINPDRSVIRHDHVSSGDQELNVHVESLNELRTRILGEFELTRTIGYAQFRMGQMRYDVEGARANLHPLKTWFWRAYAVGAAIGSMLVAIFNAAGRENWYERLFDSLQTLTFLWVGLFGLLKLSSEDPNIIRHSFLGYRIIRDVNDLGSFINVDIFKLALINGRQPMNWLSAEDLCFATPRCTGNVRIQGGLLASEAAKEGLLVSEKVAIYVKQGKAFRVSEGHIDKSIELTGEDLSTAMPLSMRIKEDFNVAGP